MPVTTFRDLTIHYTDEDELNTLLEEIWRKRSYYADLNTNTPYIIDAGAHIGITTLYLHSLYPQAEFLCIEPNPQNLILLKQNLAENNVTNVTILPKALSKTEGTVKLFTNSRWTVFSSLLPNGWTGEEKGEYVDVETIPFSSLLTRPIDLVKMDIEGEETIVIREAQAKLHFIKHIIIEFHKTHTHHEEFILKLLRNVYKHVDVSKDERKERTRSNQLLMIEAQ